MNMYSTQKNGFTLVEIMISILILALVVTGAYQLSLASNTLAQTQKTELELRNEGNIALESIAKSLQEATEVDLGWGTNPDNTVYNTLTYKDASGTHGPYCFSETNPDPETLARTNDYIKSLGLTDTSNIYLGVTKNNNNLTANFRKNLQIRLTLTKGKLSVYTEKYIFAPIKDSNPNSGTGDDPYTPCLLSITPSSQTNGTPPQSISIISQNTNLDQANTSIQIGSVTLRPSSISPPDNNNQQSITITNTDALKQLATGTYDLKVQGPDTADGITTNIVLTMPNAYTVLSADGSGSNSATPFLESVSPDCQYGNIPPQTLTIICANTNFNQANTTIQFSNQSGSITLKPSTVNNAGNSQQIITVTDTAALGQLSEGVYDLTVNNLNLPNAYRVLPAADQPEILSVNPSQQYYGMAPSSLTIATQNANFNTNEPANTSIQIGPITLTADSISQPNNKYEQNIVINSDKNISLLNQLPIGIYDLVVSDGNNSITFHDAYTVLQAPTPVLLSVSPTYQYNGMPPSTITIISQYTNLDQANTSIKIGSVTLTPSSISSPDNNAQQIIVINNPTALGQLTVGKYDVSVQDGSTVLTLPGAYTVQQASATPFDMAIFTTGMSTYISAPVTGNVGSNGNVNLNWGGNVNGNIYVPNGYNVIVPQWSNLINGSIQVLDQPRHYILPPFPAFPTLSTPSNDSPVITNGSLALPQQGSQSNNWQYIDQYTINQDGQYSSITINNNATLYINVGSGTRNIRVSNLNVGQGSIVLIGTGNLNLYVDNSLYIKGYFNGTSNAPGNPSQATLYYGGTSPLTFSNETQLYGNLWMNTANLSLTGSGAVKGNIITGGNNVQITGGGSTAVQALYAPNAYVHLYSGSSNTFIGSIIAKTFTSEGGAAVTFGTSSTPFPVPLSSLMTN